MADYELAKLLETQISLTEWLAKIGHENTEEMRDEDNVKRVRIGMMNKIINMPFDEPTTFPASELTRPSVRFKKFLADRGEELCALRLIPKPGVKAEKLRNRGKSIRETMDWFHEQRINPDLYDADFIPHFEDYGWSTIFIVNDKGIFGEIFYGAHSNLTQGFYKDQPPSTFSYDYRKWTVSPRNDDAAAYLKGLVAHLYIKDKNTQGKLTKAVGAEFTHDYIKGYFESVHSPTVGTWFVDYNRLLGKRYQDYVLSRTDSPMSGGAILRGSVASQGEHEGAVHIIYDPLTETIAEGDILVCVMTTPDYVPHMLRAGAIITDRGGILCHAAIIARELNKPCVVGTQNATQVLRTGDRVVISTSGEVSREETQTRLQK